VKEMEFSVPCVRQCLLRQGRVFTVRSYCLEGRFYRLVSVDGVGLCWRELVGEARCKDDLLPFVELSGFTSVDDWWQKIVGFCGDRPKWLYKVFVYRNGS
jgi:hypothetical protein